MNHPVASGPAGAGTGYSNLRDNRRLLVSDIDGTLLAGSRASHDSAALGQRLVRARAALVLATGRDLDLTLEAVNELVSAGLPRPAALICSVGSEIFLGQGRLPDQDWAAHIAEGWDGAAVRGALAGVTGLEPQPPVAQRRFKASYFLPHTGAATPHAATEPGTATTGLPLLDRAAAALIAAGLEARLIASAGRFLDVLPARASKGAAVGWLLDRAAFDPSGVVVAGDSGNDREMLLSTYRDHRLKAVVVGNHEPELADLAGCHDIYLASAHYAAGVLEGINAYGW